MNSVVAPRPRNEILPHNFADAKIFIPSKGRAHSKKATWSLFLAALNSPATSSNTTTFVESSNGGTSTTTSSEPTASTSTTTPKPVPFTVVVEPQDEVSYRQAFQKYTNSHPGLVTIAVLPENDQGVSYARNYILHNLAPKPDVAFAQGKTSWFWIMDDDIEAFLKTVVEGRLVTVRADECLTEVYRRLSCVIALESTPALAVPVGLLALEYLQFAFQSPINHIIANSYCNIAVLMNLARMPQGIRYRFRVREDYDFALQIIRSGRVNLRFKDLAFRVPAMAKQAGGMTTYYHTQRTKDIRTQNKLFVEAWNDDELRRLNTGDGSKLSDKLNPFVAEVIKGTADCQRYDIKVNWAKLNDLVGGISFLRALAGEPKSAKDPLSVPLHVNTTTTSSKKKTTTTNTKKKNTRNDSSSSSDDDDDDDESDDDSSSSSSSSSASTIRVKRTYNRKKKVDQQKEESSSTTTTTASSKKLSGTRRGRPTSLTPSQREEQEKNSFKAVLQKREEKQQQQQQQETSSKKRPTTKPTWQYKEFRVPGTDLPTKIKGLEQIYGDDENIKDYIGEKVTYIPEDPDKEAFVTGTFLSVSHTKVKGTDLVKFKYKLMSDQKGEMFVWTDAVYKMPSSQKNFDRLRNEIDQFFRTKSEMIGSSNDEDVKQD